MQQKYFHAQAIKSLDIQSNEKHYNIFRGHNVVSSMRTYMLKQHYKHDVRFDMGSTFMALP